MPETKTVIAGSWDNNMYVCLLCIIFVSQSDYLHRKSNNCPQFIRALIIIIIIIIIINDNVYGAVLMTKVTARVQPVHLMNAD